MKLGQLPPDSGHVRKCDLPRSDRFQSGNQVNPLSSLKDIELKAVEFFCHQIVAGPQDLSYLLASILVCCMCKGGHILQNQDLRLLLRCIVQDIIKSAAPRVS